MLTDIRKPLGIVDQVRISLSRRYLLATLIGALLGAIVPLATFAIVHTEIDPALSWYEQPEILIVAGGLIYSARTVYQWGRMAFASGAKALGFTMLIEGVMTLSSQPWLSGLALVYLCGINAIATGTTSAGSATGATGATGASLSAAHEDDQARRKGRGPVITVSCTCGARERYHNKGTDYIAEPWEELDVRGRMWGVFGAESYSPDPVAIFLTEDAAAAWLTWQQSLGDDSAIGNIDNVILPIDNLEGQAWNSCEPPPVRDEVTHG